MNWEAQYRDLCLNVMKHGDWVTTRVGKAFSLLGQSLHIEVPKQHFPLLTTRRIYPKPVLAELSAFLTGTNKLHDFVSRGCNYWNDNALAWPRNKGRPDSMVEVGKIYGYQWRNFNSQGYDQIGEVLRLLREDPDSRRIILTAWNPLELEDMCLPPCHIMAQFHTRRFYANGVRSFFLEKEPPRALHCSVYMRSVDLALGLPSDIVLYFALMIFLAEKVGMTVGELNFHFGDAHVYEVHAKKLHKQLIERMIRPGPTYQYFPELGWNKESIQFANYNPWEPVKYELLV